MDLSIAPSSAGIWAKFGGCTGYPSMMQHVPEPAVESEASREGTAAHELAASIVKRIMTGDIAGPFEFVGEIASNGIVITDELFQSAQIMADDFAYIVNDRTDHRDWVYAIELFVSAPRIHPEAGGRLDFELYDPRSRDLFLWDFKNGRVPVDAFENWQMMYYAAGLLDVHSIDGQLDQVTDVHMMIVQPRAHHRDGPARTWTVKASDLRPYINQISAAARTIKDGKGELRTGSHCKRCPARLFCPAAQRAGVELFEAVADPLPDDMTFESLSLYLSIMRRAYEHIKAMKTATEEQIEMALKMGAPVPGFRLEQKSGNRQWTLATDAVAAFGDMLGENFRKIDVITPTQAINDHKVSKNVIENVSHRPPGKLTLVEDHDGDLRRVFGTPKDLENDRSN